VTWVLRSSELNGLLRELPPSPSILLYISQLQSSFSSLQVSKSNASYGSSLDDMSLHRIVNSGLSIIADLKLPYLEYALGIAISGLYPIGSNRANRCGTLQIYYSASRKHLYSQKVPRLFHHSNLQCTDVPRGREVTKQALSPTATQGCKRSCHNFNQLHFTILSPSSIALLHYFHICRCIANSTPSFSFFVQNFSQIFPLSTTFHQTREFARQRSVTPETRSRATPAPPDSGASLLLFIGTKSYGRPLLPRRGPK
jgi:hypothetical protein